MGQSFSQLGAKSSFAFVVNFNGSILYAVEPPLYILISIYRHVVPKITKLHTFPGYLYDTDTRVRCRAFEQCFNSVLLPLIKAAYLNIY